ncbi:hypothetical protein [Moorella sp. E306M]|uniref:hypothetical protein n=1 Tax=Moorella sp. E306M TaxID=2572683 RepID=UPI00155B04EC|nr:hypothetical protein [Moorella sp. E306M]
MLAAHTVLPNLLQYDFGRLVGDGSLVVKVFDVREDVALFLYPFCPGRRLLL